MQGTEDTATYRPLPTMDSEREKTMETRTGSQGKNQGRRLRQSEEDRIRQLIAALIASSEHDGFASVSKLLGRGHSYLQQYVRRGSPRLLRQSDRRLIARHFGIDESELLTPEEKEPTAEDDLLFIDRLPNNGFSPGQAPEIKSMTVAGAAFSGSWLRRWFALNPETLSLVTVKGDSMAPTLLHGDEVLIDRSDRDPTRDGIFMLYIGAVPCPKRITVHPVTGGLVISSDNAQYAAFDSCRRDEVEIIGRVVWVARRLA